MTLYHPRPERWPQFTVKGLLIAVTLAALLMPCLVAAHRNQRQLIGRGNSNAGLVGKILTDQP